MRTKSYKRKDCIRIFAAMKLMIKHNVGVTASETYVVKKIDSDYFSEEF